MSIKSKTSPMAAQSSKMQTPAPDSVEANEIPPTDS